MKEYRITSANFVTPGETGDPDAFMDPADLAALHQEAGITGLLDNQPQSIVAFPEGSNKGQIQREQNIKPGTEAWFKLWFGDKR